MLDLIDSFDALPIPPASTGDGMRFSAQAIPGCAEHRLAKDERGAPALLLSVTELGTRVLSTPIMLEHLTILPDVFCRVSRPDGELEEGQFTVARCLTPDRALHEYFLRVGATLIEVLGDLPSQADVTRVISRLAELFRAISSEPRKTVQGLWAELFLISRAPDPITCVRAWHLSPEDRYDFGLDSQRIEVKSTTGRVRQHYFSLEQLQPPAGVNLLLASVFVERTGAGVSVLELADQIRRKVSKEPELLMHIDQIIGLTLGENWRYASEERFDKDLAQDSLAFFETEAIPPTNWEVPVGITEVRFKADLTGRPTANLKHYRALGGLYHAALR